MKTINEYRTLGLAGALLGGVGGFFLYPNTWKGPVLGTLAGMIALPAVAGASPTQLKKALLEPKRES